MSDTKILNQKNREPGCQRMMVWLLTIIVATAFLVAGSSKLFGASRAIAMFDEIGFGQWLRYLTGLVEILGAILLLIPRASFWGALLLALTMTAAVLVHLFILGGSPSIALFLLLMTSTLTLLKPIKG